MSKKSLEKNKQSTNCNRKIRYDCLVYTVRERMLPSSKMKLQHLKMFVDKMGKERGKVVWLLNGERVGYH